MIRNTIMPHFDIINKLGVYMTRNPKLHLLFNHALTEEQIKDAQKNLGVDEMVPFSEGLLNIWKDIPYNKPTLKDLLGGHITYLQEVANKGDYLLVQGDFGATYIMVEIAKACGVIPIYATTQRKSVENIVEGKIVKTSIFEHGIYREYGE